MNSKPSTAQAEPQRTYTGADAVVASLEYQEVKLIFGITGGAIMPVYDSLYKHKTIRHIIAGHEQGAAHMADGYARATGRPGVVVTTSGPGATNLVTGLANAMMDSIPMVAITGQVSSNLIGNDCFQEADMWGITLPVTKHNYQISDVEELPQIMAEAFYLAQTGRPGPVLIDLPKDVMQAPCKNALALPQPPEGYEPPYQGDPALIIQALELIRSAQRPVILAGGGVIQAGASDQLLRLAQATRIPVTSTLMGLGNFPAGHELFLGMPGMHGTLYANKALFESDLIIAVGCRLDDRVTGRVDGFAPQAKLIHIDIDASEINKIIPAAVGINGDAAPVLRALADGVDSWSEKPDHGPWLERVAKFRRDHPLHYQSGSSLMAAPQVIETLGRRLDPDTLLVTGVGQHQMFTAQFYPFNRPRGFITSGGLGTMGFGLPAALGAKMGCPERQVVCVDGDGSFLMNIQELATAVRYRIGVVVVVLNNQALGMVRQWQDLFADQRYSETDLEPPAYDKVAQAFGGLGQSVTSEDELEPALSWALEQSRLRSLPVVLDVKVDRNTLVLPMVKPGGANIECID